MNITRTIRRHLRGIISLGIATHAAIASISASKAIAQDLQTLNTWVIETQIHKSLPPYRLSFDGYTDDEGREYVQDIFIDKRGEQRWQPHQHLSNLEAWSHNLVGSGHVIEDLNFDGYADLRVQEFLPASPNIPYLYWLFNPTTRQFEANTALSIITTPEVNAETQTIRSFARVNANTYVWSDYQWRSGQLTLVREERATYNSEGQRRVVISELQGDRLVVVSDRFEAVD
ncbi:MAG: hypothetical protein F6J87_17310 [Spirulina sp. SIO3F2]|nr:hypothetical protein [Spirulina sp. SIO3F2]